MGPAGKGTRDNRNHDPRVKLLTEDIAIAAVARQSPYGTSPALQRRAASTGSVVPPKLT
jgi:hypothetical protein